MSNRGEFEWDYASDITASANALDPMPIGLHQSGTAGLVTVVFGRPDADGNDVTEQIYIAQGDYVKCKAWKVTNVAAGQIAGLYKSNKNRSN